MQRREFITLFGGAATTWPLVARAQQPLKMKRIAIVFPSAKVSDISMSGPPRYRAFFEELRRLGYVEGQNLKMERYSGEGQPERYAELARHVVNTQPDLIFALGIRQAAEFKMATAVIPIVAAVGDPVALGLVESIAKPGGNITGATVGNHWKAYRVAGRGDAKTVHPQLPASRSFWEDARGAAAREAAKRAGISLKAVLMGGAFNEAEYQRVFRSMEQDRADALMVSDEAEPLTNRATIVELAAKSRIPAPQVFDLLSYLIRNRESVVSNDDLVNAIWKGRIVSDAAQGVVRHRPQLELHLQGARRRREAGRTRARAGRQRSQGGEPGPHHRTTGQCRHRRTPLCRPF